MNKIVTQTANIITSLGTVIFVLLMTVIAMIFVGHGLYYQVFIKSMSSWQAEIASWVLSFGVETTVLVITCNVKYFSSKNLPLFFAICSGFIVLFFINAFDLTQSSLDISIRWFIGLLVVGVNYVYSELFVKKFQDAQSNTDLLSQIETLKLQNTTSTVEVIRIKADLVKVNQDVERLTVYIAELEEFKQKETDKLKCPFCHTQMDNIYRLASHKGICNHNPKRGQKESIFEAVA